jgi:hypothetical protein
MKKKAGHELSDDPLDRELDFEKAMPNRHAKDYYKSPNLVVLEPDVLELFPTAEAVNEALRLVARFAKGAAFDALPARRRRAARTVTQPNKTQAK